MRGYQFLKNSGEGAHWLGGGALAGGGDHQRARNRRIHDAPDSQTLGRIIDQTVTLMPLHADKRVRAIAVSSGQRLPQMADVPTLAEGGMPQFDLRIWNGLVAPKGTPRATLDKLASALSQVIDSPEFKERVEKQLASQIPSLNDRGPDAFRKVIEADHERVSSLVKAIGMKPAN